MEYFELLLGWILGIISLIVLEFIRNYFSTRKMKAQQEYNERILKIQLYRDERKKALVKLDELLKKRYKTFTDFKNSIESFLNGSSAIFLPSQLRKELGNEISDVDSLIYKISVGFGMPDYKKSAE